MKDQKSYISVSIAYLTYPNTFSCILPRFVLSSNIIKDSPMFHFGKLIFLLFKFLQKFATRNRPLANSIYLPMTTSLVGNFAGVRNH